MNKKIMWSVIGIIIVVVVIVLVAKNSSCATNERQIR